MSVEKTITDTQVSRIGWTHFCPSVSAETLAALFWSCMPKLTASKQLPPVKPDQAGTSQDSPKTSSESRENSATKCHTLPGQGQIRAEDGLFTKVECSSNCVDSDHDNSEASAPEPATKSTVHRLRKNHPSKAAKSKAKRASWPTEVYKLFWRREKFAIAREFARLKNKHPALRGRAKVSRVDILRETVLYIQNVYNR